MMFVYAFTALLLAVIAQAGDIVVEVDSVSCSTLALKINATAQQFANLPQDLQVTVNSECHFTSTA